MLTVIEGGCHILDYLLHGASVTATDEDVYQIALLDLKTVSILHLPFDQFFAIFGQSNITLLRSVYRCSLRSYLKSNSADYWDQELPNVCSFMYAGGWSGYIPWLMFRTFLPLIGLGFIATDLRKGVDATTLNNKIRGYKFRLQTLAYLVDSVVYRFGMCLPIIFGRQTVMGMTTSYEC